MKTNPFTNIAKCVALLIILLPIVGNGQWQRIATLQGTASVVKFFTPTFGLLGNGASLGGPAGKVSLAIFRTTDGGFTWLPSTIPTQGIGAVTDFYMMDTLNGWASVIGAGLWRTFDGGITWNATTYSGNGSSVHLTSRALIVTDIGSNTQISVDSGVTWFQMQDRGKNDVSFSSNAFGVTSSYRGGNWEITTDGGLAWNPINQDIESWSLYADKNTGTIYATPEGPTNGPAQLSNLIVSHDSGATWQTISSLPFTTTGHIGGVGDQILFAQECSNANTGRSVQTGFYMSSDKGMTWSDIGGPQTWNDTRFAISVSCDGSEGSLYAFDQNNPPGLFRYHFTISGSINTDTSSSRYFSTRIINDSLNITIHLPIYFHHSGTMKDVDMIMHYPIGTLKYLNGVTYNGKSTDISGSQWSGRAALHFTAVDLNAAPDSLLGYANFLWTPFEFACDEVLFDSIDTHAAESPCSLSSNALPFTGIIGSYKTCGISSVPSENIPLPDYSIHPNPTTGIVTIEGPSVDHLNVDIINLLGETAIALKNVHGSGFTIDLSKLSPDMYYIRFTAGTAVVTRKVVKE